LNVIKKLENDNKMTMDVMVKYIAVKLFYGRDINENMFINNKRYREEKIKEGIFNEYLKKFDEKNIKIDGYKFINNEFQINYKYPLLKKDNNDDNNDSFITSLDKEIPSVINDNELNVTEEPESDVLKKFNQLLKYLLIIKY
jgi:hypothetical protein